MTLTDAQNAERDKLRAGYPVRLVSQWRDERGRIAELWEDAGFEIDGIKPSPFASSYRTYYPDGRVCSAMYVHEDGNWRQYTTAIPTGAVPLGTVERDASDKGALVLLRSGRYVQVNAGAIRSLDQQEIARLLTEELRS